MEAAAAAVAAVATPVALLVDIAVRADGVALHAYTDACGACRCAARVALANRRRDG